MSKYILALICLITACSEPPCETKIQGVCYSGYQGYIEQSELEKVNQSLFVAMDATNTEFDTFVAEHPFYVQFSDMDVGLNGDYQCGDEVLVLNKRWMHNNKQRCNAAGVTLGHEWLHHYATNVLGHDCDRGDGLQGHNVPDVFTDWAKANNQPVGDTLEYLTFTTAGHSCGIYDE